MDQETTSPRMTEDANTQPHPQIKFTFKGQNPSTTQSSSSSVKSVPPAQQSNSGSSTLNNADLSKPNRTTSSLSPAPIRPVQGQESKEDIVMEESLADEVDRKVGKNGTGSSQVGNANGSNGSAGEGERKGSEEDMLARPRSKTEDMLPPTSDSANPDSAAFSPMITSENPSRAQSPTPRESTPALSEAPSDTPSVDSNFAGPPPEASAHELAHPLSAYQFANTTLVPVASTSTNPFQFVSWPPQPLEDSWQRTRLPDDDEAYLEHDSEAGYRATPEEIEASKAREEARQAKIKAKLSAQVKGKGKAKEPVSRPAPKARAMERVTSTDSALPPKRPRPQKTPLQQEVQPEPEINRPRPIVSKTRFNRELAMALLPDDVQTATPAGILPHPEFIDLFALPPHYITEEGIPPPKASAPLPSRGQRASVSKPQSPAVPADTSRPPTATATPTPADSNTVATEEKMEVAGMKRARETTDEGTGGPSKKAKEKEQQETESVAGDEGGLPSEAQSLRDRVAEFVVQSTTCLSKKIDGQVRCFQCIARAIGHGCCFLGVRSFGVDNKGVIITKPIFLNTKLQDDVPRFTKQLIAPINEQYNQLMRTWLAPQLLPIIERERKHAETRTTKRVRLDLNVHSMCDTCNSTILGSEWMCDTCGRVACRTCHEALINLEKQEKAGKGVMATAVESQRRKKCIAKKRGERGIAGEGHSADQFIPMTRLDKKDLAQLQADLYKWKITHAIVPSDGSAQKFLDESYLTPSPLPDYDPHCHPVHQIPAKDMNAAVFLELWLSSHPVLVTDVKLAGLAKWTPSYIANRYPSIEIQLQNNKGTEVLSAKVPYFFGQFNEDGGPQRDETVKQTFRTKDFPTARQFKREFLELAAEFYRILPIRDLIHPDGPLNFLAHTPVNALQPDVGPRGTNSWAVDAATGTTLLRTDITDIASLMYWGHHDEATGRELRIRWDVYRSEDIQGLRDYCWEILTKKMPKGISAGRFRETHDDPLLNPCIYLNQRQREHLAITKKIYSHAVYQYPGQLVLIPAGCPYQVSSWSDHLSLTTQFLAGPRLPQAISLNDACRHETKERTLWRTDNIQLERQLLYAWYSCQNADKRYKPTPLNWRPRDNQTASDMARAAVKDPKIRGEATKAFNKLPGDPAREKEKEKEKEEKGSEKEKETETEKK